jgi:hypothetical protein
MHRPTPASGHRGAGPDQERRIRYNRQQDLGGHVVSYEKRARAANEEGAKGNARPMADPAS